VGCATGTTAQRQTASGLCYPLLAVEIGIAVINDRCLDKNGTMHYAKNIL
jgi:hypothetical protein